MVSVGGRRSYKESKVKTRTLSKDKTESMGHPKHYLGVKRVPPARRLASRNGSGAVYYYFTDHLGSTRAVTDASGKLCYDADFSPYGQEMSHTERLQTTACQPSYKFTGYERDPETTAGATDSGLDYAFARYYSPRLGRFLSTDPLGGALGNIQSQ